MDDLDHSIHIAEHDWTNFWEESEECSLLKPSIARPDSSGPSDSEDSEISSPVQLNRSRTGEEQDENRVCSAGNCLSPTEVHTKATDGSTGLSNKIKRVVRRPEMEVDNSRNEPDPSFFDGTEPRAALSRVGDRPAPQQAAASSVRQKPSCKDRRRKHKKDSEGPGDKMGLVQLKQTLVPKSGEAPSAELKQVCCKDETVSEFIHIAEHVMGGNTQEPRDVVGPGGPSHVGPGEPDGLDFGSIHSSSAAESAEEPLCHVTENQQQLLLATSQSLNTNHAQDRGLYHCDSSLACSVPATECDGCEGTGVEASLAFPSAEQRANKMPDDSSTCDEDTHSTERRVSSDTPALQNQETHLSASGGSSGRQLSPGLDVTPCSAANSAAEAVGLTGPVYAISAFWNEMEKLTINDILRLRTGRSTSHTQTQDTGTTSVRGFPTNHTFLADGVECNSSDAGPMDTSDIADSDYFTQPDESVKPDCSSCELSTSDFEEEYWHFSGASRNPSPDPQDNNLPRTHGSPFLTHAELLYTEGEDAPVPSEGHAGHELMKPSRSREMTKTKTEQNIQALNREELTSQSLFGNNGNSQFLRCSLALEEKVTLKQNNRLETLTPAPVTDKRYQISIPELFEHFFTEDEAKTHTCGTVCNPEDISATPVPGCTFCNFRDEMFFCALHDPQKPSSILPGSHPTDGKLTFPKPNRLLLNAHSEDGDSSPVRVLPHSFTQAGDAKAGVSRTWQTFLSIRSICFHTNRSTWCRRSGAWVFPVDSETASTKRQDPPSTATAEERGPWRIWEKLHTSKEQSPSKVTVKID